MTSLHSAPSIPGVLPFPESLQLTDDIPGLSNLRAVLEANRRVLAFVADNTGDVHLLYRHSAGTVRDYFRDAMALGQGTGPLPATQVLELSCVDPRIFPPDLALDLPRGSHVRQAGPGPSLVPVKDLDRLVELFNPPVFLINGHSNCKAFDGALRTAHGIRTGTIALDTARTDAIAYSVIDKIVGELDRCDLNQLVDALGRKRRDPEIQRMYASLNMAFMRGQLRFLREHAPLISQRVRDGRLLLAAGFIDLPTQAICLDIDSLWLNDFVASNPVLASQIREEFGVFSYDAVRASIPVIEDSGDFPAWGSCARPH